MKPSFFISRPVALFLFLGILVLSFSINSCRKADMRTVADENRVEEFFRVTGPLSPGIQELYDRLKKQNERDHFVNKLPLNFGVPVWQKVQIQQKHVSPQSLSAITNTTSEEEEARIPMSAEPEFLSGVLEIKETTDSSFSFIPYSKDCFYERTHADTLDVDDAKKLLGLFLYMDFKTFGAIHFENIPKKLFPGINFHDQTDPNTCIFITSDVQGNNMTEWEECLEFSGMIENCTFPGDAACTPHCDHCPACMEEITLDICWSGGGSGTETGSGTTVTVSPGGTGGSSGNGANPVCGSWWKPCKDCDKRLEEIANTAQVTSELESVNTSFDNGNTREKIYKWVILRSFPWHLTSTEKGVHEKINNEWQWQSLQHQSIDIEGFVIGVGVEPHLESFIAVTGLYHATMALKFNVKYSLICRYIPVSWTRHYESSHVFEITD